MRVIVLLLMLVFNFNGVSQTKNQIKVNPEDVKRVRTIKIKPYIKIKLPSMYSRVQNSQEIKIIWEKFGKMDDKVKIKLMLEKKRKDFNTIIKGSDFLITAQTENSGKFIYTIPENIKIGKYRIVINTLDKKIKAVSQIFTIEKTSKKKADLNIAGTTKLPDYSRIGTFSEKINL